MNRKITFAELAELVTRKHRGNKRVTEAFLREMTALMCEVLARGEELHIEGLGHFRPVWVEPRQSVNVQSGEPFTVPGHYKLSFTPDPAVRDAVNEPFACFAVEVLPDDAGIELSPDEPAYDDSDDDATEPILTDLTADEPEEQPREEEPEHPVVEEEPEAELEPEQPVAEHPVVAEEPEAEEVAQPVAEEVAEEPEQPAIEEPLPVPALPAVEELVQHEEDEVTEEPVAESAQPEVAEAPVVEEEPEPEETVDDDTLTIDEVEHLTHRSWWRGFGVGAAVTFVLAAVAACLLYYYFHRAIEPIEAPATEVVETPAPVVEVLPADTDSIATDSVAHAAPAPAPQPAAVVTDTVRRGVFLTTLSLRHYGHKAFWVYIYEENKAAIANPDNVDVGTVVVIPPAAKYGINAADTAAVEKALRIADELKRH